MAASFFGGDPEQALALIERGESDLVEFKRRVSSERVVARTFAAFANSRGGVLFVGVDPRGNIVGLTEEEARQATASLLTLGYSMFDRPVQVGQIQLKGQLVVYAVIPPFAQEQGPVLTAEGIMYRRRRDRNVRGYLRRGARAASKRELGLFVAMSFHEEEEPALADYFAAMQRAVESTGLPITIKRMDLVEGDYEISQRLMNEIDRADIVLADFTLKPPNVYFEVGYARGQGKRVIQTARRDTVLEFDVRNWRTTFYRNATELEARLIPEVRAAYRETA
jgi:hypothetical protein